MTSINNARRRLVGCPDTEMELTSHLERLSIIDPACDTDSSRSSSDLGPVELELNRLLSLHAEHPADARPEGPFTKIGAGACGAVYAQSGKKPSCAIKLSKTDDHSALWNDYITHTNMAQLFDRWEIDKVRIPACHYFVPPTEPQFFVAHPGLAPVAREACRVPTSALVTERIPPLPERVRSLLIDKFCAPRIRNTARADPANRDCLARVYLGSTQGRAGHMFFSLRNFKLHLNHVMELQLDVRALARGVATALAIMHWAAEVDARDVEFVFGSSIKTTSLARNPGELAGLEPLSYTGPPSRRTEDFFREVETTQLWVLDFDKVRSITMDRVGVAQAVEAARLNDPYIPRPLQESADEREAWAAFALAYLEAANVILMGETGDILELPLLFIQGLVGVERARQQQPLSALG